MHSRRPSQEHQDAVSRRLALLSQELSAMTPPVEDRPAATGPPPAPVDDGHTRVRAAPGSRPPRSPEPLPVAAGGDRDPPLVPRPGRHASRRPGRRLLPGATHERLLLGPAQLAVVSVVVALGLAVTTWWVARGEPHPVAAPVVGEAAAPLATPAAAPGLPGAPASSATPAGEITVDVAGKVRRPGIVVLAAGARVVDAIEAAGGARPGVDLGSLNLARPLLDGEQVVVGVPLPPGVVGSLGATPAATPGVLVNLNTAGQAELETLPDVGPVTAQAILAWRTEHGGFSAVDELLEVDGIGEATLATLAPLVTV